MTPRNYMVIGLQIGKLHVEGGGGGGGGGGGSNPPLLALPDSEKLSLFRINYFGSSSQEITWRHEKVIFYTFC